ncbi:MAG: PKD domain-containing protein [Thermoplasmatota archaeon]
MRKTIASIVLLALVVPSVMAFTGQPNVTTAPEQLNDPPATPTIQGPSSGKAGTSYTYTFQSTDPDGDDINYCFTWGDGDGGCTNYVSSGEEATVSHTWDNDGDYTVEVYAEDKGGAKSDTATMTVTMPLSYDSVQDISVDITAPKNGVYLAGFKVFPILGQVVFGDVTVEVDASSDVQYVEFLLQTAGGCGRAVMHTDTTAPYTWEWDTDYDDDEVLDEGLVSVTVFAYDEQLNQRSDGLTVLKLG